MVLALLAFFYLIAVIKTVLGIKSIHKTLAINSLVFLSFFLVYKIVNSPAHTDFHCLYRETIG